ncbi:hypothetical protein JCM8097_008470 [Rhodosporidiobolus ruineniae]
MPRPSGQIPLDYQHPVLQPKYLTLLDALATAQEEFWCTEFEELYQAYSGWLDVWTSYRVGLSTGEIMDAAEKDLLPEWWWLWLQFAILPAFRSRYITRHCPVGAETAFLSGEWIDVKPAAACTGVGGERDSALPALPPLPSLRAAREPEFYSREFGRVFTPASWMADAAATSARLPSGASTPPSVDFLRCIGLLPAMAASVTCAYRHSSS